MSDLISRQVAIDEIITQEAVYADDAIDILRRLPSAQPERCSDCIAHGGDWECDHMHCRKGRLPSAQAEPISEAYANAVWTWLINYQIKAAELKGRYTPYEVLSWVANDWRKEHERSDQQTGGD